MNVQNQYKDIARMIGKNKNYLNVRTDFMHSLNLVVEKKNKQGKKRPQKCFCFYFEGRRAAVAYFRVNTPHMFSALRGSICSTHFATV